MLSVEANSKMLHALHLVSFQLYDILKKTKLLGTRKVCGARGNGV